LSGTRDRIIAATNELFRRHGYNGTSLKQVSIAAEAPTGSVYHFFPGGKTDLAQAVILETGASYQELFTMIAGAAADTASGVRDFFDGAAEVLEQSNFIDVCPIGSVAREVASTNEALRLASAQVFDGWIEAVSTLLEGAGLTSAEAADLAATVIAAVEGGFVLARAKRDAGIMRAIGQQMRALVETRVAEVARR
jgi:AcrR family transcriptional regulator